MSHKKKEQSGSFVAISNPFDLLDEDHAQVLSPVKPVKAKPTHSPTQKQPQLDGAPRSLPAGLTSAPLASGLDALIGRDGLMIVFTVISEMDGNCLLSLTKVCRYWKDIAQQNVRQLKLRNLSLKNTRFLSDFPALHTLDIKGASLLNNSALRQISRLTTLTSLNLQGLKLDDELVLSFTNLQGLRNINLSNCANIGDASFALFRSLPKLNTIRAKDLPISSAALKTLANNLNTIYNLTYLNLEGSRLDALPHNFRQLSRLQVLKLSRCGPVGGRGLSSASLCEYHPAPKNLQKLSISIGNCAPSGFRHFHQADALCQQVLTNTVCLMKLSLTDLTVTVVPGSYDSVKLSCLGELRKLIRFRYTGSVDRFGLNSEPNWLHQRNFPHLTSLTFLDDDTDLRPRYYVANKPARVNRVKLLECIGELPNLRYLELALRGSGQDLEGLNMLPNLHTLVLYEPAELMLDSPLPLKTLKGLKSIALIDSFPLRGFDEPCPLFDSLEEFAVVGRVRNTSVPSEHAEIGLTGFSQIPNLRKLELADCRISPVLQQALFNVQKKLDSVVIDGVYVGSTRISLPK